MKFSIVVPCYNESKNIPLILKRFNNVFKDKKDVEVILVNNGSNDNSNEILDELIPKYNFAKTIYLKKNKGYGYGIKSGLNISKGEYIGYTHADMQTDPEDLLKGMEIITKIENPENCYVKGDRKGRLFWDQFFTSGMSLFETFYLGVKLWDINAQPNIFHKSFYNDIKKNCPNDFSLDLFFLYMAKKRKLKLIRFDVVFPERIHGKSSWNTGLKSKLKFIKRTLSFSVKLKRKL